MARIEIVSLAALGVSVLMLAGCSFIFVNGVEGAYTATGKPLIGKVSAHNEPGGTLALGSSDKQECQGRYKELRSGISVLGLQVKNATYKGRLYCLDGRTGSFELISAPHGRTGSITGEIGGEAFRLALIEPKKARCDNDECRWGLKWTYGNELRDMRTYNKVEAEHIASKAIRSAGDM
ncbi:Hypothetical protein NGAL_HAMBI2605_33880 [Neorhizobium galegae bv. orientalis]|nr:Hypothetical protein NGAL_HAMBI2605_33880 [Neorhizobium galegae bv. orientalis]